MIDYQSYVLHHAVYWPVSTSLALLAAGALYGLQGFRFARVLLAITCAGGGFAVGGVVSEMVSYPPIIGSLGLAVIFGLLAIMKLRVGVTMSAGLIFGLLGNYIAIRAHLAGVTPLYAAAAGAFVGLALAWGRQRSLPILVTTVQGAGLMLIGFVGVAATLAPTLAGTFVDWAGNMTLMVPMFLVMLIALGYSVQANLQQGDIRAGSTASTNWAEDAA